MAEKSSFQNNQKAILTLLENYYGRRTTALKFSNAFELLLATILSAQTNDKQVNKVTEKLFSKYHSPQDYAELSPEQLAEDIKGLGLYKNKSKNIIAACRKLIDDFNSQVPATREELMQLPGVGRKTANVVLAFAFGQDAFPVDTHVFRVANKLGLADSNNVLETEKQLLEAVPKDKWSQAHHWLIWHGREICQARKPKCAQCMVKDYCKYNIKS